MILEIKILLVFERTIKVLQHLMFRILFRKISVFRRNALIDTKRFIQDRDTTISLWVIEVITFILEYRSLRQDNETIRKALRYKELAMIIFRQFYSHMLTICRRTLADIHGNILHSTLHTSHQLALGKRRSLKMQTTHHTIRTHTLVVLAELHLVANQWLYLLFKLSFAEALEEIATSISKQARLNDEYAIYICLYYFLFLYFLLFPKFLASFLIRIKTTYIKSSCRHFPGMHIHLFHHIMRKITWGILATTVLNGMSYFIQILL